MVIKKLFLGKPVAKIATNSFLFIRRFIERRDPKIQQTGITLLSKEGSWKKKSMNIIEGPKLPFKNSEIKWETETKRNKTKKEVKKDLNHSIRINLFKIINF
jgi:hypothetical protein